MFRKSRNNFPYYEINWYFCRVIKTLVFTAFILALWSCGTSSGNNDGGEAAASPGDSVVTVAVMPTLDCLPLFVASETGMFAARDCDVRLEMFAAQMDCDTALVRGHVDGIVTDTVRLGQLKRQYDVDAQAVVATRAYWLLVANRKSRVSKTSQLADKMIAMTRYSATDLLTTAVLRHGSTVTRAFRIQVNDVGVRLSMLLGGVVDAAWLSEPLATMAVAQGHNVIADSRSIAPDVGVIAFRSDALETPSKRRYIDMVEQCYRQASDSIASHGLGYYSDIMSKYCGVTAETVDSLRI